MRICLRKGAINYNILKTKGSLPSIEKYKQHNKLDYAIKISTNNYGYNEENKIRTVPLYEVFLIAEDLQK